MKVLILGGYGVFGGRLAELLSDIAEIELVICGRNLSRAIEFCDSFRGKATVRPLRLDRAEIAQALEVECPDLVVDASGPFQNYGDTPYGVITACIASGTDYVDFADAADFVFGVSKFNADAEEAGAFVLSGVSSFPVLTGAVLREMAKTMDIVSVRGGIAPSPFAGIGLNVMRAVVGYAGAPVKLYRNGVQTVAHGLAESMRYTIAVPGRLPLRNIRFSLVDVPDLQVVPPEHETMRDIWMGAGPVPEFLHRILNLLARARAATALPSLTPLSRLFYTVLNLMKFGEHRGGMFVHARGLRDGKQTEQSWHLLAEGDDGPYIPSMAIEAIIRRLLDGIRPQAGARPAIRALDLADYDQLFAGRSIYAGFRGAQTASDPIYRQVLGAGFETLPSPVKALHDAIRSRTWRGQAEVMQGKSRIARAVCRIMGFPDTAADVPVSVALSPEQRAEAWTRTFGEKSFSSVQKCGTGRNDLLILERFGMITVALALVIEGDRLLFVPRSWSLLGIPLPRALMPTGRSFETGHEGRFRFDVEIAMPGIGLIVAYKGTMEPV
ncbi:saccharopine dehydrogenase-like NADP-dependent oxidoreductase [Rhizobium sp. BK251]|nr:saccharopine dehydrogenase-like NADP-dependent oxidoreductase [Rhizobium sp. BK251]